MIQPGASFCTHHNFGFEIWGYKYKINSKQVQEANYLLQDDDLSLEVKAFPYKVFITEVKVEMMGQIICKIINVALDYDKRLACVKRHQDEHVKAKKMEWASFMLTKYPLKKNWEHIQFSNKIKFGYGPKD